MSLSEEVRAKLADVASNRLSVWAFENWLEPQSWNMHRAAPEDVRFVASVQNVFARYDYPNIDESKLVDELAHKLNDVVVVLESPAAVLVPPQPRDEALAIARLRQPE